MIPLGIYRLAYRTDNLTNYVITNPEPSTVLLEDDQIFILS